MITGIDLNQPEEVLLVTGCDTGVGKTVFSGLFCRYLIDKGFCSRLAKPFCSGATGDIVFLAECSGICHSDVNYWYYDEPVSPAAWELRTGKKIDFEGCVNWLLQKKSTVKKRVGKGNLFLVEGVGGLLAPLSKGRTVSSLGNELDAKLIIVAINKVGVVNHVLLTVEAALVRGLSVACVVLMGQKEPDASAVDNAKLLQLNLPAVASLKGVFEFPWLGEGADDPGLISTNLKKAEGAMSAIFDECVLPLLGQGVSDD